MGDKPWSDGIGDLCGYIPVPEGKRVADSPVLDAGAFARWDNGFEFYAPQSFVDDAGRAILIGWMGMPEAWFCGQPEELGWIHCLTVPRVLMRCADGRVAQAPVAELEQLRGEAIALRQGAATLGEHRADLVVDGIEGTLVVSLDGALEVRAGSHGCEIAFVGDASGKKGAGCGRASRSIELEPVHDLRVLVDSSAVEVYANGGHMVFSTRWFPTDPQLSVRVSGNAQDIRLYPMGCE